MTEAGYVAYLFRHHEAGWGPCWPVDSLPQPEGNTVLLRVRLRLNSLPGLRPNLQPLTCTPRP